MLPIFSSIAVSTLVFATLAQAQYDAQLVGTWTTKSKKVVTGPGFYNPVEDKFIEPELTGISYSFTADGWYEEAYYRAISNPSQPGCPSAIMQWQHGRYTLPGNGSIIFEPIEVDGRQQTSTPCSYTSSLYIRYAQPELMSKYAVAVDKFHNVQRLDMFQFDGSPMHPMYLEYQPPLMLPTQTLNPTATASGTAAASTGGAKLRKRGLGDHFDETDHHLKPPVEEDNSPHADYVWWLGVGSIALGTAMYMIPTSVFSGIWEGVREWFLWDFKRWVVLVTGT